MAAVLIVDDDGAMREALAEAVRDLGLEAEQAPSGHAALASLDAKPVDAVLLDLRMPGMDGLEVLRSIRARPRPPPVTILTAHATATNTIEAMRLGAFDHLTKPIGRTDLARVRGSMVATLFCTVRMASLEPISSPSAPSSNNSRNRANSLPSRIAIGIMTNCAVMMQAAINKGCPRRSRPVSRCREPRGSAILQSPGERSVCGPSYRP